MCLSSPNQPPFPACRKIVFHETDPWCQKYWGLLPLASIWKWANGESSHTIVVLISAAVAWIPSPLLLAKKIPVCVLVLSRVWLFCDPLDCSSPGSSVQGISQTKILEGVTMSFSRGSFHTRDWTHISCIGRRILYYGATWEALSSLQSLSRVQLFVTPWTAAHQASLSITNSQRLLKFMSIETVMPSNHLILCRPLLLLPSIFPSIRVFSNESALRMRWPKYWEFQLQHQSFQWTFRTDFL